MKSDLEPLDNLDGYRRFFMDIGLWQPHVQTVCRRHALIPCQQVRAGLAGSFPTFIVEDRWVVKFFGRLLDGKLDYEAELQVNRLLPPDLAIHVPSLLYSGVLCEGESTWSWSYLIYEYLPGISIGQVDKQVSYEDKLELACTLGKATRQLRRLRLDDAPLFQTGMETYTRFLQAQRASCVAHHHQWKTLPEHLIDQLEDYLLPVETLVDPLIPHGLIHADITRDHILGRLEDGHWVTLGLIDFGDARVGNLFYDLGALHIDLFRCDTRLLRAYLEAYDLKNRAGFTHKAMSVALLHQFNIFSFVKEMDDQILQAATLSDLAKRIWDIEA
jgi:hygromycin-B 7''-O-kinase